MPGWLRRECVILLGVTFLWPSAAVLPFNYLTPVFSLGVAGAVLGEHITLPVVVGAVGVVGGVALSQLPDVVLLRRGRPVSG